MKRLLPLLAIPLLLTGCGLRPVYGGGTQGAVAQALGNVDVAPIEGRGGWLVRNALNDRLGAMSGGSGPHYRLVVKLDDQITGFGLRADAAVTRERRTLRARYQLIDEATGAQILDDTAGSDAGIDVTSSEYATIAAEDTALERLSQTVADQIVTRLALFSRKAANP
ncbi:LPS assembly lipoprotein LptE [Sphingobium sp. SA2]|jgi:LPS-assembly lipoprotein|uniref:LPS assembly lipoprotein LptE n=1 Tax=Sphingobium sp. SA2 TaxID=1524832 RepID=UPI0028C23333|nr:LPS assembly lipoprotein LptE [Sphingobium sp. SA2]MDT7534092.1 LPS assembly lipoprotein LptE [Sphingobium sp. SA2]